MTTGQTEFFYLYCLYVGLNMIDLQCGGDNFDCSLGCRCLAAVLQWFFSVVFSTPIQSLLYAHVNVADMYCQHTIESTEEEIHKKFLRQIFF